MNAGKASFEMWAAQHAHSHGLIGVNLNLTDVAPSLIGGGDIMKSIEDYQARANEYARLADSASDELLRAELLLKMKTYLGVVARLRNYAAGKGLSVPTSQ
jgi:hypothetical protein